MTSTPSESHFHNFDIEEDSLFEDENHSQIEVVSVSHTLRQNFGTVKVKGTVIGISKLFKMISKIEFFCDICEKLVEVDYFPPVFDLADVDKKCNQCNKFTSKNRDKLNPIFKNALIVELQDIETFNDMDRLPVFLFDNDTDGIMVGETVIVKGDIEFQGLLIIFIMVIMILVPFGLMTLKRLINRNIITDRRILDLEYIRNYFKKNASIELKKYFPFQEYDVKRCPRHLEWKDVFSTKRGGLVETAALINCIILGIIGGLFVFYIVLQTISQLNKFNNFDLYYIILTFTLYSLTAWVIQFYYVKIEYEKECKKRNKHLLNRK